MGDILLARTKLRLPGAEPTTDGHQPPRQLTPINCACGSPWLLLVPERVRPHQFYPRVGTNLLHPSLSLPMSSLPSLTSLTPSLKTLLPNSVTRSHNLFERLTLNRLVRLIDLLFPSEASRTHPQLHLPGPASTSVPAFLRLSLSRTSWAAPIAGCAPTLGKRPTSPSTSLEDSERLRLLEHRPEHQPSQCHLPSSNLLRSIRPLPALQSSATIHFPPTRASTRMTWRLRWLT